MISLDERNLTLRLSVADLVGDAASRRRARSPGRERLEEEARARYLEREAPAGYRAGVELGDEFSWRDYRVSLTGRADGIYAGARGAVVEVHRFTPTEAPAGPERAIEAAGLLCLLLVRTGATVHKGAVVDLSLVDELVHTLDLAFSREAFEQLLEERLERLLRGLRERQELARRRAVAAQTLPFPFASPRRGQDTMLREVEGAAASGLILLCSAPTGIGKTAAALHPMLARALAEDRVLFFVTARVSQQELALDTLRRQLPPAGDACAVQISAKDRICPQDSLGCVERGCPLLHRFAERLTDSDLLAELARLGVVDSGTLRQRALDAGLCPFELSLELALRASVVVADYNYVFDPNVYLRRFFDGDIGEHLLIVDEAHQLPERARESYSAALDCGALGELAEQCEAQALSAYAEAAALLREACDHVRETARTLEQERGVPPPWLEEPDRSFWERIAIRVDAAILRCALLAGQERTRPPALAPRRRKPGSPLRDPLLEALYSVRDFCSAVGRDPEHHAALWSWDGASVRCLDAAPVVGPRLRAFRAAVCMSATLVPFDFYASLLGAEGPRSIQLELDSPFPRENRRVLAVPGVDTTYRRRSEDAGRIAATLASCLRTRPGNYLAFFPSFAYRDQVVALLPPGSCQVLIQTPAMPTEDFLARLRDNRDQTLLLCGVLGGVFAEGVDYPGDMAHTVFIVGPGLPALTAERELVRAYHEERRGRGFEYAYVYPGLSRVIQAGGRALRTPADRAAIVLLGRRFCEPLYRDPLPGWWREELEDTDSPAARLEEFWKARGPLVPS